MSKKTFLVTGGNGYIGSHLCKLLAGQGHAVHIMDNFSTSPERPVHAFGKFHSFDIADQEKITQLVQEIKPDCLFHFAARALVEESESHPFLYYQENVYKTLQLLQSYLSGGGKKIIFSSTCATFGLPEYKTIDENHPQNPINSYGMTKKIMEMCMRDFARREDLDVVVLRYFNVAGCSPDGDLGENHHPETHLIPNLCRALVSSGKVPFNLFGDDYNTDDGSCVRDYIHVEDLVHAHYQAYDYLENKKGFFDFNLGPGKGYSVKQVITAFEKVANKKLEIQIKKRRPGDPAYLVANNSKAKKELNFKTKYDLEAMIEHTLNWFKKI